MCSSYTDITPAPQPLAFFFPRLHRRDSWVTTPLHPSKRWPAPRTTRTPCGVWARAGCLGCALPHHSRPPARIFAPPPGCASSGAPHPAVASHTMAQFGRSIDPSALFAAAAAASSPAARSNAAAPGRTGVSNDGGGGRTRTTPPSARGHKGAASTGPGARRSAATSGGKGRVQGRVQGARARSRGSKGVQGAPKAASTGASAAAPQGRTPDASGVAATPHGGSSGGSSGGKSKRRRGGRRSRGQKGSAAAGGGPSSAAPQAGQAGQQRSASLATPHGTPDSRQRARGQSIVAGAQAPSAGGDASEAGATGPSRLGAQPPHASSPAPLHDTAIAAAGRAVRGGDTGSAAPGALAAKPATATAGALEVRRNERSLCARVRGYACGWCCGSHGEKEAPGVQWRGLDGTNT